MIYSYIYICYLNNTQQLFSVPCNNDSFKCVVISYCLEAPSVEGWILNTQYSRTHLLRPLQKWGKGVNHFPAKLMMLMQLNKNKTKKVPHRGFQPKPEIMFIFFNLLFQSLHGKSGFVWDITWCLTDRLKTFHLRMSYDLSFNVSIFIYLIVFAFRNELLHVWMTKWNFVFYIGHHTVILCSR